MRILLEKDQEKVETVEHLLFALYVLGITDIIIEVQGGREIPILDGSSRIFIEALEEEGGIIEYKEQEEAISPQKEIIVEENGRKVGVSPSSSLEVEIFLDYPHPFLQKKRLVVKEEDLRDKVASARTFGFYEEREKLYKRGFAKGADLENTLVFSLEGTLNPPRFPDEAVYHKVLDLLGDLYILGRPIIGKIFSYQGGHKLDILLAQEIKKSLLH